MNLLNQTDLDVLVKQGKLLLLWAKRLILNHYFMVETVLTVHTPFTFLWLQHDLTLTNISIPALKNTCKNPSCVLRLSSKLRYQDGEGWHWSSRRKNSSRRIIISYYANATHASVIYTSNNKEKASQILIFLILKLLPEHGQEKNVLFSFHFTRIYKHAVHYFYPAWR
jgi:hypothetical protein